MTVSKQFFVILAPLGGFLSGLLAHWGGLSFEAAFALGVTVLTTLWWMTEAVPIPIASLVPIALFPLFGVLEAKTSVAQSYGHPLVLLLLGGFMLSKAMEKSGVHKRIAIGLVRVCGRFGGRGVVLGFMLTAALLSMWISNTATTLMLLPIALAAMQNMESKKEFAIPLMLGVAYAANIGGLGSPIGTPPNLVFIEQYARFSGKTVSFFEWMQYGVPVIILMLPCMWLWLCRSLPKSGQVPLPQTGEWRTEERRVLIVFGLTVIAWITRKEPFGGWSGLFDLPGANDTSVAFIAVILLFIIPSGSQVKGERLLDWETVKEVPWGVLILFGGGICLANGIKDSGLSEVIASQLSGAGKWAIPVLVVSVCLLMTFLTEVTSNTASTILMMPILGSVAMANEMNPALFMLPAALSASCAFMLPVATAPNAVVFGTGMFSVQRMMREGMVINLIGVVIIGAYCWLRLG